MKERPIMARGHQVRAILEGRQTQMRRVAKYNPFLGEPSEWGARAKNQEPEFVRIAGDYRRFCPYGQPRDRLWVKESFAEDYDYCDHPEMPGAPTEHLHYGWKYKAGGQPSKEEIECILSPWKSPLFMPRSASRITLELVNVRVERVQDISEEDAECEGVELATPQEATGSSHKSAYRRLWDSIHGKGVRKRLKNGTVQMHNKEHAANKPDNSWAANPWVWVLEFKRVTP